MSRSNLEDELGIRQGGERPELYAHLLLTWARLSNLVADSVCPQQQFDTDHETIPILTYYTVSTHSERLANPQGAERRATINRSLAIASWIDSKKPSIPTSIPQERRFGLIKTFQWQEGMNSYQKTYAHLGRHASSLYRSSLTGMSDTSVHIPDYEAEDIHKMLEGEDTKKHIRGVARLREEGAQRARELSLMLPSYDQLSESHDRNITGLDFASTTGGERFGLEAIVTRSLAYGQQERTQLTKFDAPYLPYIDKFLSGYVSLAS